jgi:hypothetical protein
VKVLSRVLLTGLACAAISGALAAWLTSPAATTQRHAKRMRAVDLSPRDARAGSAEAPREPNASPPVFDVILESFEDGGFSTAMRFTSPLRDPGSLQELRQAVGDRGRRGIAELEAQYKRQPSGTPKTWDELMERLALQKSLALLNMYEGNFPEAAGWVQRALDTSQAEGISSSLRNELTALMGIIALRRGEVENCLGCVGPSSCIFPIAREAVHANPAGSREAVRWFRAYLRDNPRDLRVIWLLNIAYMTLGEYPEHVPAQYLIPVKLFKSAADVGVFVNVAPSAGLTTRGPNLAGGSLFEDLTGDGLPDVLTTSLDAERSASLYVNRGDGKFNDSSLAAGLSDQIYALNVTRADVDNDGDLDLLLLRGGWESPMRLSLLTNRGDGSFDDVTIASGLGEPISTEAAAWGDYDNDGWLDLFVCGEYLPPSIHPSSSRPDPRNRCRLYHNNGDGTFRDVAAAAGVLNERCAKGAAWGDYDGDGQLDLFVSNMGQHCRLYHNEGGGVFRDVASELGVAGAPLSFACWFWDYDNDGQLDLYVNDFRARPAEVLASAMGVKIEGSSYPRLYRNLGSAGFKEVSRDVGLDRALAPMGANFGDVDNDGYLDIYLGTGDMSYSGLDPDVMFKNVEGRQFVDVTTSAGVGHLQKGHGVSFADSDGDGDLDLFVELGGAAPGDQAYNVLYQNPSHGRHWLKVQLVGTTTNRAALGTRIRVDSVQPNGATRTVYRTIGNNSSFGGNSLVETVGLLDATSIVTLTVTWPTSHMTQTFHDLASDQAIAITEGCDTFRVLSPVSPSDGAGH